MLGGSSRVVLIGRTTAKTGTHNNVTLKAHCKNLLIPFMWLSLNQVCKNPSRPCGRTSTQTNRLPGNTVGETTTNFFFPFFPKNPVAISQAQMPNSKLPDKRRRCSKDATYALENSNSISEYTSVAIVVSRSHPYTITRQAKEKNPKNKKTKNTHFQISIYMTDKKKTNEFYTRLMMSSCSLLVDCSYGFINPKPLYDLAVFKLLLCENDPFSEIYLYDTKEPMSCILH
jgi:hypothetical protein